MKSLALILGSLVFLTATLAQSTTTAPSGTTVGMTSQASTTGAPSTESHTVPTTPAKTTLAVSHTTETTNASISTNSTRPTMSPTTPSGAPPALGSLASCLLLSSVLSLALL
ncbi:mucin-2-like [Sardina pilchardus]|uniref:mucin-2-like n=1 Tax=Sardina pilchardus TaxID=27697 RepID=UPI002E0E3E3E